MTQPQNPQPTGPQPYGQPAGSQPYGQPYGSQPVEPHVTQTMPVQETTQTTTTQTTTTPITGQPPATPAPAKKNPLMRFVLPIAGAILLALAGALIPRLMTNANFMKTGQCVTVAENGDWKKADCNASGLTYTVGKTGDGAVAQCNGDAYLEYTASTRTRRSKINKYACLMPNFKEGTCYVETGTADSSSIKEFTCGGNDKTFKILKKVSEGNATCAQGEAWHYADEKVTYCIGQ